uniref:Putative conserved secreted protein n=1 Tax=Culex tarsalis TaxID=7177 RepID=A0A1Q3G528_CULTA
MACVNIAITMCLLVTASTLTQSKPLAETVISDADPVSSLAVSGNGPSMRSEASPIYHAGIASVNGRFGKSIRAFTVNEFEKYIDGLV